MAKAAQNMGHVKAWLKEMYGKRAIAASALCAKYAKQAERNLKEKQGLGQEQGYYWTNRTSLAIERVRGYWFLDGKINGVTLYAGERAGSVGWGLAHTMEYGKWLELARNRQNEALRPTVAAVADSFYADLRKIYAD